MYPADMIIDLFECGVSKKLIVGIAWTWSKTVRKRLKKEEVTRYVENVLTDYISKGVVKKINVKEGYYAY